MPRIDSAGPSPCTTKPVRSVIWAAGACVPKFQTMDHLEGHAARRPGSRLLGAG
jgi:hypothetical protein